MTDDAPNAPPPIWRRAEPDSPCVQICMIHPSAGLCVGCGRTADEIAAWATMTADARSSVRAKLPDRMKELAAAPRRQRPGGAGRRRARPQE